MSQHDMDLANAAGASFRADLNNALLALVSHSSGATAPSTTFSYMLWADTTLGLLKIRNAANNAWLIVCDLASGAPYLGAGAALVFEGTTDDAFETTLTVVDPTADRTLTLPNATDTLVGKATTDTLTNKRITARVGSTTSHATPTINTDNVDIYKITAQTEAITSMTTNLSGTPTDGQVLIIQITGTAARAITWGASFEASTVALPTTTVTTAMLSVGFLWNTATSKWRCMAAV